MLIKKFIPVTKFARVYQSSEYSESVRSVWIVLHGYAQRAEEFISIFTPFYKTDTLFVAPEGLSRFYINGFAGNVGATWMTKDDREKDIEEQYLFLNQLYDEIIKANRYAEINVLGFSQGLSTAARWMNSNKIPLNNLLLWSGDIPKDVDYNKIAENCNKLYYVYGTEDKLIDLEKFQNNQAYFESLYIPIFESVPYQGGHGIKKAVFNRFLNS